MKVWNKLALAAAALAVSGVAMADPTGVWRTIDDQTGQAKSLVRITNEGGKYVGRIQQVFSGNVCNACEGNYKGKNLSGVTVLWGVTSEGGNKYGGGRIMDPKNDKVYKVSLTDNGNSMTVRGYIGVSAFGRNQTWQRVQ